MKLLVGLGNPTSCYELTRHNAGFLCLEQLASEYSLTWTEKKKLRGWQAQGEILGAKCLLLKPQTWMNNSGMAVAATVSFLRLSVEDVIVIHDDLDVPTGRVKCRSAGSSGGHNGVQSVIDCLQTPAFQRIKLGVARPPDIQVTGEKWVLGKFTAAELELLRTEMYEQVLLRLQQLFGKARA